MKLVILIFLAFVACVVARPQFFDDVDPVEYGLTVGGYAVGVGAVPVLGLAGGAVGLLTGGPKAALAKGAYGARAGADIAQEVGGQYPNTNNRGFYY